MFSFMNDIFNIGTIFKIVNNQDNGALSEGDVINIEVINDMPEVNQDFNINNNPSIEEFTNEMAEILAESFSYLFTFLIELDPL